MCIDVLYGDVLSRSRFVCATYIRCSSDAWYMYSRYIEHQVWKCAKRGVSRPGWLRFYL
jgi:hypothetical protein